MRRTTPTPRFVWLAALSAIVACSGPDPESRSVARVDTAASGRVEVTNTGLSTWTQESAWTLEEDLRLGTVGLEGPAEETFGFITSIAADSRGRIYILDFQAQEIRVFEADGSFSHTIGGRGRGPGELDGAWEVGVGPGDTLTVLDDGTMRFSVFEPDGTFVESHPRTIVGYGSPLRAFLDDGGYVDWAMSFPDGRGGPRVRYHPVRYSPGFTRADTFPPIHHELDMVESGRRRVMEYGSFLVATADAAGAIWFADSREYSIHRRTLEGDTTLSLSLPAEPTPLTEADRDRVRDRWAERPEMRDEQLEALPEVKPLLHGIVPDGLGHLLVFADVRGERPGTVVDVFRESGEYLGRMRMPEPVPLQPGRPPVVHVTRDHLYVLLKDELEVPFVSRLEIVRSP